MTTAANNSWLPALNGIACRKLNASAAPASAGNPQDYTMYGVKITNQETNEIGLLLYTWTNKFADADLRESKPARRK